MNWKGRTHRNLNTASNPSMPTLHKATSTGELNKAINDVNINKNDNAICPGLITAASQLVFLG